MKKSESNLTGVKEIARRANVSIGTVDRVLHNRKGVSEETKQKINAIIEELDFRPNKMASLLANKKVVNFAVLIPKVSDETDYWSFPLAGIQQAETETRQFGVKLHYFFYDLNSKQSFLQQTEDLLKIEPQAILLAPTFVEESLLFSKKITELNIPFVFINSDLPKQESLCYIGPDLFQSGRLSGQLVGLVAKENDEILIINISSDLENDHHLLRKEQGFKKYFEEHKLQNRITTLNIDETKLENIEQSLIRSLAANPSVNALFVTNSRVNIVAKILVKYSLDFLLVGYDFMEENVNYLKEGVIDFLICQRPKEQGYLGLMALYKHLFNVGDSEKNIYMPIDIITNENYQFYKS
jgi:LacI family transcriptional regulator